MYTYQTQYSDEERIILIYDFGGGKLDVSLVKIKGNEFTVLATAGDSHFGGSDIDDYILRHLIHEFREKYDIRLNRSPYTNEEDKYAKQRALLLDSVEKAKRKISGETSSYQIFIPNFITKDGKTIDFDETLHKSLIDEYIEKIKQNSFNQLKMFSNTQELIRKISKNFFFLVAHPEFKMFRNLLVTMLKDQQ